MQTLQKVKLNKFMNFIFGLQNLGTVPGSVFNDENSNVRLQC